MIRHVAFRMHLCATGNVHQLHRHRRGRLNGLTWNFHRISRCGPSPTLLLLFKVMTRHMCLIPPIWFSRLIIKQQRLIPPLLLLLLKTATSRICPSTVRLVIFTTEPHRNFSQIVETVAPLPTVDVMSVTVVRMTVARQSLIRAYSVSHQRKLSRHKLKGPWGKQTRVYKKKLDKRTPCEKNLSKTERTTGAEDTQNQNYQRVRTVVDTLGPKHFFTLDGTRSIVAESRLMCLVGIWPRMLSGVLGLLWLSNIFGFVGLVSCWVKYSKHEITNIESGNPIHA